MAVAKGKVSLLAVGHMMTVHGEGMAAVPAVTHMVTVPGERKAAVSAVGVTAPSAEREAAPVAEGCTSHALAVFVSAGK